MIAVTKLEIRKILETFHCAVCPGLITSRWFVDGLG